MAKGRAADANLSRELLLFSGVIHGRGQAPSLWLTPPALGTVHNYSTKPDSCSALVSIESMLNDSPFSGRAILQVWQVFCFCVEWLSALSHIITKHCRLFRCSSYTCAFLVLSMILLSSSCQSPSHLKLVPRCCAEEHARDRSGSPSFRTKWTVPSSLSSSTRDFPFKVAGPCMAGSVRMISWITPAMSLQLRTRQRH